MTKPLSEAQILALRVLRTAEGWRTHDKLKKACPTRLDIRTLKSLLKEGYVVNKNNSWRITPKGVCKSLNIDSGICFN